MTENPQNMKPAVDMRVDGEDAVVIALGSNDKGVWPSCVDLLEAAIARFRAEGIDILARSSWWRSAAWPDPADPPFVNGVAVVSTSQDPHTLMATLGRLEETFGRQRGRINAPRTLDLDLVAYGRLSGDLDGLILPHPRAADRLFVMGALAEITPEWVHPTAGKTAQVLAESCTIGTDARPIPGDPPC